jgi:hypothetical protein
VKSRRLYLVATAVVAFAAWRCLRPPAASVDGAGEAAPHAGVPASEIVGRDAPPGVAVVTRAPFQDADAAEAASAPRLLALSLLGDDGAPLADAEAFLLRGGAVIAEERADAAGLARFPADGEDAVFIALAAGYAPFQGVVALTRGAATARQAAGAALSGTITIEGAPAPADFALDFRVDTPFPGTAELPPLGTPPRRLDVVRARVDARGAFRIGGLAPDVAGRILWPPEFESIEAVSPRAKIVERPSADLRIVLRRTPELVGRLLLADGAAPAAKTEVTLRIAWGMLAQDFSLTTDSEGRFRGALAKCPSSGAPPAAVSVIVAAAAGPARRAYDCTGPFDASLDVGDLRLPAEAVENAVRFVDEAGAPLRDVVVVDELGVATKADAEGRAAIHADHEYVAAARGRLRRRFRAADAPEGVLTLAAAGAADIRVKTPGGKAAEGVVVIVSGKGVLAGGAPDAAYRAVAVGDVLAAGRADGRDRCVFRPDAEGRVVVPETACDAELEIVVAESEAADARVLDRASLRLAGGVVGVVSLVAAR